MILMLFSPTDTPSIYNQPQSIYVKPGQNAVFPCYYTGFPTPIVQWTVFLTGGCNTADYKNGAITIYVVRENKVFSYTLTVSPDGSLLFPQVPQTCSGSQFQCTVTNRLGKDVGGLVNLTVVNSKCCYTCKRIVFAQSRVNTMRR